MDGDAAISASMPRTSWHVVFEELAPNGARAFTDPLNATLIATGMAGTVALSGSEADHHVRQAAWGSMGSETFGRTAELAGYVAPIAVPGALLAAGFVRRDRPLALHGAAAFQSVLVTFSSTVVLKLVTGRPFPLHGGDPSASDRLDHPEYAREWNFFRPQRGYAWPSGHASTAFALAASLSATTADVPVTIVGYGAATAISVGMLVGDHHWASDVLAGALLGQAVGDAVGRGFRARWLGRPLGTKGRYTARLVPKVNATGWGLELVVAE